MSSLDVNSSLRGGKYRIERVLGQGGFGITYLAQTKVQVQGALGMIECNGEGSHQGVLYERPLQPRRPNGQSVRPLDGQPGDGGAI